VESISGSMGRTAEGVERFPVQGRRFPVLAQGGVDLLGAEGVVSRWDRCVGGEDSVGPHLGQGVVQGRTCVQQLTDPLHHHEGGMTLVGVPHVRRDPNGPEHPNPTHSKNPFLAQTVLVAALVELLGQVPVRLIVLRKVGVQEEDGRPPHHHLPSPDMHGTAIEGHGSQGPRALPVQDRLERGQVRVELGLIVFLPPFQRQVLIEVTLQVEQPHADHRDAQVRRRLAVVAGQHAQTTRIDGHGVVYPELRAEIGHDLVGQVTMIPGKPGFGERLVHGSGVQDLPVPGQKILVPGQSRQPGRIDLPKDDDGVSSRKPVQDRVNLPEELSGVTIPSPGEIQGDSPQALEGLGKVRDFRRTGGHVCPWGTRGMVALGVGRMPGVHARRPADGRGWTQTRKTPESTRISGVE